MSAVLVEHLVKRYGATSAVQDLSFTAPAGAITTLLGPNGAGKTTTVEICEGLRRADTGVVRVLGHAPGSAELRARVGVMPQRAGAYPGARCAEMLQLVAAYYQDPHEPAQLLAELGLDAAARTPFRRLSGGQQQRLSLAMAIVGRPAVLFLDEPSAGLDVQARHAVWDLVRRLRDQGVAVILTTHDMEEATQLADQVLVIDHGRLLAAGSVAGLTGGSVAGDGGQGTVRFRAPAGLDLAGLRETLPEGAQAREAPAGTYLVEGEITPQLLSAVSTWTVGCEAPVRDLSVVQRSLEDVFLELTGRELRG